MRLAGRPVILAKVADPGDAISGTKVDRGTVVQQLRVNAAYLDDSAMIRYITLIGDQMAAFAERNPRLCARLLRGETDIGDVREYLPKTLQAQEMLLVEEALLADKSVPRRRLT